MTTTFKCSLFTTTLLAAGLTLPAFAQGTTEQPQPSSTEQPSVPLPEASEQGDAIVVTGSRIASPEATAASPLQIVSAESIEQSCATNVQDVICSWKVITPR